MADKTQLLELEKPTQNDFYDVEVQNRNMDIIDQAFSDLNTKNNVKTYTALSQIGLTPGAETIADIVNNLPDGSILIVGTDGNHNVSIYPDNSFGTLFVIKRSSARTLFLYSKVATNELYYGNYYSPSNAWSGWVTFLQTTGGTLKGGVKIESDAPFYEMKDINNNGGTKVYKNASPEADYGTYISDIASDGTSDVLIIRRAGANLPDKIFLRIQKADGSTYETYRIYGEHNKPTPADIGAATKEEVQTAQSTAETAKTNAATAQSTANTAKNNAATAQSTADAATTKADNAQSSANMAQTTADEALNKANSAATTKTYTVNVSESEWGEDDVNGGYYCEKSVTGILATDNPIVDIALGSDIDANQLYISAWSVVTRVVTDTDVIILYANTTYPQVALSLQVKVVR